MTEKIAKMLPLLMKANVLDYNGNVHSQFASIRKHPEAAVEIHYRHECDGRTYGNPDLLIEYCQQAQEQGYETELTPNYLVIWSPKNIDIE